jgi:hypothetical protein
MVKYYRHYCSCKKEFYLSEEPYDRHLYVCLPCYYEQATSFNRLKEISPENIKFIENWIDKFKNKSLGSKLKLKLVAEMI